jgi:hypothetical protein
MGKKSKKMTDSGPVRNSFSIGDRVSLHDLATVKYNGKGGVVKSVPKEVGGRFGILLEGENLPLAIRPQNLSLIKSKILNASRKSTQEQLEERQRMASMLHAPKESYLDADQLGMFRAMMEMFMTPAMQIKAYGRTIDPMPDFRAELLQKGGGFPRGVDPSWADHYLRNAFEHACGLPHMFEITFKQKDWDLKAEPGYVMKRLSTSASAKSDWYFSQVAPGSIFGKREAHPYTALVRHSFSNQAYRKEVLHQGTTHVAVGFVDLGMLFAADLKPSHSRGSAEPLRFLGVDMSAYSIAKTHVVWELLRQAPSPRESPPQSRAKYLRQVLQVWYSASWGEGTFEAVKQALESLLSCSVQRSSSYHPDVRDLLEHWLQAPILPLKDARNDLVCLTTDNLSAIGHLLRQCDRIALAKYELTRDFGLLQGQQSICGNTLMFDCPDGTPPLQPDETVFSAFQWGDIMTQLIQQTKNKAKGPRGMNIIEAAEQYAIDRLGKMATWAQSNTVEVELKCAAIQDVVQEVATAKPFTMSWSNIVDYLDYQEFHDVARACSIHGDTIHFGYSMNWTTEVFGTNVLDFRGSERADLRASILDQANQTVQKTYSAFGWDKYLRSPPPTNPINTASSFVLDHVHYRAWTDSFFQIARRDGPVSVGNVELPVGSPLSTTGDSTVVFTWTYSPEVHFDLKGHYAMESKLCSA